MDLLGRYLDAVKPLLPRKTQNDILREISDDILSQMEDRAEALGRPLTEDEQADVIRKHGHPVVAAARYGTARYLIGPEVFPFYWLLLKIAAIGALVVRSIVAIVGALLSADPARALIPALIQVPSVLLPVFFWVTAVFAAFELCQSALHWKLRVNWDPRSLPAGGKPSGSIPRTHSVAEIIFGLAGFIWWQALPSAPYLALGPSAHFIAFGPVWEKLHWPVLLLISAGLIQAVMNLLRPYPSLVRNRVRLLIHVAGLAVLWVALRSGNWFVAAPSVDHASQAGAVANVLNQVLFCCGLAGFVIGAMRIVWECVQHLRESLAKTAVRAEQAIRRH